MPGYPERLQSVATVEPVVSTAVCRRAVSGHVVAGVGRQRDGVGLEDATDLTGDGGSDGDPLTVLVDGRLLQAIEIAEEVGPFDGGVDDAGRLFRNASP